jgi:hypothetical protein
VQQCRDDPGQGNPVVRKGIVAQSTIRFAAAASVIVGSLLVAGPNPAQAVADRHGSGSHRNTIDSKSDLISRSNIGSGGVGNWSSGALGTGGREQAPSLASSGELSDLAEPQSIAPDGPVALRSAAVPDEPLGVNASGAVTAPRGGFDSSAPSARAFRSPRVVFGNGRSPGEDATGAGETLSDSSLQLSDVPEPDAAPEAAEIAIPSLPPAAPPTEYIRAAVVAGELGIGTIDTTTDPLAGVAGLILIPAVGAVLGYRQARAAQSVRESART